MCNGRGMGTMKRPITIKKPVNVSLREWMAEVTKQRPLEAAKFHAIDSAMRATRTPNAWGR